MPGHLEKVARGMEWDRFSRGVVVPAICQDPPDAHDPLTSTLAAGIMQDMFAGEAEGGEEMTGGYFYCYFYCSGWKFFRFLANEFLSQNTNTRMRIRNVHTYTYIYKYNLHSKNSHVTMT